MIIFNPKEVSSFKLNLNQTDIYESKYKNSNYA
jgi:hypothetical protein